MNAIHLSNLRTKTVAASIAVSAILAVPAAVWGQEDTPYPVIDEYGVPEGYVVIEGDIFVPEGSVAATYRTRRWPQGDPTIVPFRFDADGQGNDDVSQANQTNMLNAMAVWEGAADVDFRACNPCTGNFIHIRDSTNDRCGDPPTSCSSNSSQIGMSGGQQVINITSWGTRFIIVHELAHALGYWHEQSRADRDGFVRVNLGNVCQTCCSGDSCDHNFDKRPGGGGEYGPYDFDSVMHYGQCAFSSCAACPTTPPATCSDGGRTITVLPPNTAQWQNPCGGTLDCIGQRNHLSRMDTLVMSFLYPEDNWRFLDNRCSGHAQCEEWPLGCLMSATSFLCPWIDDLIGAVDRTPIGGTLWVLSGDTYSTGGTLSKRMTIRAPLGGVILDR